MALTAAQLMDVPGGPGVTGSVKAGANITITADGTISSAGGIPAGSKTFFAQATAPVGWVQDTSANFNDIGIRVVNGAGGGFGGTLPFTSVFTTSSTVTGEFTFTSGVTADTTLDINQIPTHSHGVSDPGHGHGVGDPGHAHSWDAGLNAGNGSIPTSGSGTATRNTTSGGSGTGIGIYGSGTGISIQNNGGGGGHNHGLAGSKANFTYTTASLNLKYVNVILCTKS